MWLPWHRFSTSKQPELEHLVLHSSSSDDSLTFGLQTVNQKPEDRDALHTKLAFLKCLAFELRMALVQASSERPELDTGAMQAELSRLHYKAALLQIDLKTAEESQAEMVHKKFDEMDARYKELRLKARDMSAGPGILKWNQSSSPSAMP